MGKHSYEVGNYLTEGDKQRAMKTLRKWVELYHSETELCLLYGIARSTLYNWLRGKSEMKVSMARLIEYRTKGKIKARDLLGV